MRLKKGRDKSDDIAKPFAKLPSPGSLLLLCELMHIATCIRTTPETFVKICDEVCDAYSNAKCDAPNNARLRFLVSLKVFCDTLCILKFAML
jgi:hypothetical protein